MGGFNYHSHAKGAESLLNAVTYLHGKPLLDLKAACIGFHYPRNLAQSGDFAIRDVCHMSLADKWHDMMLTS